MYRAVKREPVSDHEHQENVSAETHPVENDQH